jgi:signal transduction histidine kinase
MSKPLLQKNTRFLITWLPVVLLAGSLIFYFVLQLHAHHMQEKQLLLKQSNVWTAFTLQPDSFPPHIEGEYDLRLIDGNAKTLNDEPTDTSIYLKGSGQSLPFEVSTVYHSWNGKTYQLSTYVSSREIHHLIIKVFLAEAVILILLLLTVVIVNNRTSLFLWKPFFSTIQRVKDFDIRRNQNPDLPLSTGTTEFDELNKEIASLIGNANQAYIQQKQFVENASHEMQTPLAIIRSKLELLINQQDLTEKTASLLSDITEANEHLSQMNRTLLLLAKIENNQFPETEKVHIPGLLRELISNYRNYYNGEFPPLTEDIHSEITVDANHLLVEILLSNILKNAIEHNKEKGFIDIKILDSKLLIKNPGIAPETETSLLFNRFIKGSHQSKSTGLGLALVKQICLLYNYEVKYSFREGIHEIIIDFSGRV